MVRGIPISMKQFIGGDLNGHVGMINACLSQFMEALEMVVGTSRERKSWTLW